mmetsp:Transcript_18584/g.25784  ORF Transcript_18584/g.25784 Transcript_18584/m.25784 type:complete len:196 (-) Transcript_18584:296-883(-)
MKTSPDGSGNPEAPPPPVTGIFFAYALLGAILSFSFGRDPSGPHLPEADVFMKEVAPTTVVICLFLVSYSLLDVMHVGIVKAGYGLSRKPYPAVASNPPHEVYLAQRVQTNQVEQLPGYLVGSIGFTMLVNAKVGALLALVWAILRRMYAVTYRASVGKPIGDSGITKYTIPAYFVLNSLLMGTVVQCMRILWQS